MSAFRSCQQLEAASRAHLEAHLFPRMVFDGRFVSVQKGEMAREFQLTSGDYVVNSDALTAWRIECKCERDNRHGNFFVETYSNLSRGKPGWFWTQQADFLLYHFLREGDVYLMSLPTLRRWLYSADSQGRPRIHRYPHRQQRVHAQLNDTWGYCVNILHVVAGMSCQHRSVPPIVDEQAA